MATSSTNKTSKNVTTKTTVTKKLNAEAQGQPKTPVRPEKTNNPIMILAKKMQEFERLRGLTYKRERVYETLVDLQKFNYHSDGTATLVIKDSTGSKQFVTTNSNLIKLVADNLQKILEDKQTSLDQQIVDFRFNEAS